MIRRSEMVKFEPEAMRAFVKYKLLKKVITQCTDRRKLKVSSEGDKELNEEPASENGKESDAKAMAKCDLGVNAFKY